MIQDLLRDARMTRQKRQGRQTPEQIERAKRNRKLSRNRKWKAGWDQRERKRAARQADGLSLAERILLVMLPGEVLTSGDIAARLEMPVKTITPILYQRLQKWGALEICRDPSAPSPTTRWDGQQAFQSLFALTPFGCAMRADRLKLARHIDPEAKIFEAPPSWKIPEIFLTSFGIDFSPFFGGHLSARAGTAARGAHAPTLARQHGGRGARVRVAHAAHAVALTAHGVTTDAAALRAMLEAIADGAQDRQR